MQAKHRQGGGKEKVLSLGVLCHQCCLKHIPEVSKHLSVSLSSCLFSAILQETVLLKSITLPRSQTSKLYRLLIIESFFLWRRSSLKVLILSLFSSCSACTCIICSDFWFLLKKQTCSQCQCEEWSQEKILCHLELWLDLKPHDLLKLFFKWVLGWCLA